MVDASLYIDFIAMGTIKFSGELNADIEGEIRSLYYERFRLYPIVYSLLGVLMILLAILMLSTIKMPSDTAYGIVFLIMALALFVAAFRLQHIWWHWWWPRFLDTFGRQLYGEITEIGIKFKPDGNVVEWKYFKAIKQTNSLLLLYFDKAFAYPIHQNMVDDPSDWAELLDLVKKHMYRRGIGTIN